MPASAFHYFKDGGWNTIGAGVHQTLTGRAGNYVRLQPNNGQNTTVTSVNTRAYAGYYFNARPLTISELGVVVTTANTGNVNAQIRLLHYANDNGFPGALVTDFGTVQADSTGLKMISFSPTHTLPEGPLFLATVAENLTANIATRSRQTHPTWFDLSAADASGANPWSGYFGTSTAGSPNDPWVGSGRATTSPVFIAKV